MNENMTIKTLFNVQAHIGHFKKFRNPQIKPFLYGTYQKLDIIDLDFTLKQIIDAKKVISQIDNSNVLLISSSFESQDIISYKKWKAGMLTNFQYSQLDNLPKMLIVDSVKRNEIALKEAKKMNILTLGLCDTNADYQKVDIAIITNDDSKNATHLILNYLFS
jgi:ribosomal protein S2